MNLLFRILSALFSPVGRVLLVAAIAIGGFVTWRIEIRQTAKNEVVQQITQTEIGKLKKTTDAQDRIRRDHLRGPDRLRTSVGYRRD